MKRLLEFTWAALDLEPHERAELFDALPADTQALMWDRLRADCDARNERERLGEPTHTLVDIPGYGGVPDRPASPVARRPSPAATGRRVRVVRCPFPDHADSDPSFAIYDDGAYCFGCHRRASTADLARLGVAA